MNMEEPRLMYTPVLVSRILEFSLLGRCGCLMSARAQDGRLNGSANRRHVCCSIPFTTIFTTGSCTLVPAPPIDAVRPRLWQHATLQPPTHARCRSSQTGRRKNCTFCVPPPACVPVRSVSVARAFIPCPLQPQVHFGVSTCEQFYECVRRPQG